MALQRTLVRPYDIDIENAYTRISGTHSRSIALAGSGAVTFTIIKHETYMTKKAREDYPNKPIESTQAKVTDWQPEGTESEQSAEAYGKLAAILNVVNVEI